MKTLLVPVDFTDTSNNAVNYAAEWSKQFEYSRIILLKTFYDTLFDDIVLSTEYGNFNQDFRLKEREEAEAYLLELSRDLSIKNKNTEVLSLISELPLVRAVMQVIEEERPDTIVIGSDTNEYDNDSYVAVHVIQIAKISPVKVLVVPAGQQYQPMKEVLVPVDTFALNSLNRIDALSTSHYWNEVDFDVLSIDPHHSHSNNSDDKRLKDEEQLHQYLKNVRHHLFYSQEKNVIDAVMKFLKQGSVQLIIALPGKYSFLYRLTHKSISDAICRNTEKPVLILK